MGKKKYSSLFRRPVPEEGTLTYALVHKTGAGQLAELHHNFLKVPLAPIRFLRRQSGSLLLPARVGLEHSSTIRPSILACPFAVK